MASNLASKLAAPLASKLAVAITSALAGFDPRTLFSDGSKGVLYDNNDLTSFYLDSAGTTPATVNGLVGLQLDKSQGLVLGAELLTNGDFSNGATGWTLGQGWSVADGKATFDVAGTIGAIRQTKSSSGWHIIRFTVSGISAGQGRLIIYTNNTNTIIWQNTNLQNGEYVFYSPVSIVSNIDFIAYAGEGGSPRVGFSIDNISVKAIPGNHRYQTTTGSKPILRGTPVGGNLVTNGDFASGTGWTAGAGWAIGSGVASYSGAGNGTLTQSVGSAIGNTYRITVDITSITGGLRFGLGGVNYSGFFTTTGKKVFYLTQSAGNALLYFQVQAAADLVTIDNIEIVDVSADAVTAPYGLQFDGFDDFLLTAAVDFTATDKMGVCMGVRKLSDAAVGVLVELGATAPFSTNNAFGMYAPVTAAANYGLITRGTSPSQSTTTSAYPATTTNVVTGLSSIATDVSIVRVNGVQDVSNTSDQGTGNYQNAVLYFGRRGGTSLPFNGLDYGGCIKGGGFSAAQLPQVERWTAQRTPA